MSPRVVIGAPLFNKARHLPRTLESLLSQSYADFAIVLVDDASTDRTEAVARGYAALDPRVTYVRNSVRLGYSPNARNAFEIAGRLHPGADYFAWGSDHDVWHPRWMSVLVGALDRHPDVVLAYPKNLRIDESGHVIDAPSWEFDTREISDPVERLRRAAWGMSAGNMIYGLHRRKSLRAAGVLRDVLLPDRLLLTELAILGRFMQVPEILWYRRYAGLASTSRQVRASFPDRRPAHLAQPVWFTHAAILTRSEVLAQQADGGWRRARLLLTYALIHLWQDAVGGGSREWREANSALQRANRRLRRWWRRNRKSTEEEIRFFASGVRNRVRRGWHRLLRVVRECRRKLGTVGRS
jgi:hypothetical protein